MSTNINSTGQVSVANTATLIIAGVAGGKTRQSVTISVPSGGQTVFIGASGVTTSTGHGIPTGSSLTLNVTGPVYGVVTSTTQTVHYVEVA